MDTNQQKQKLFIERSAADNTYFHRDFHILLDRGLVYLDTVFGEAAVDEYLHDFALSFYAPLIAGIRSEGFKALRGHISEIYKTEQMPDAVAFKETADGLRVTVSKCPAVSYMRECGHIPSALYVKTTEVVNRVVAEAAGLCFELRFYDGETGAAEYRFFDSVKEERA